MEPEFEISDSLNFTFFQVAFEAEKIMKLTIFLLTTPDQMG